MGLNNLKSRIVYYIAFHTYLCGPLMSANYPQPMVSHGACYVKI